MAINPDYAAMNPEPNPRPASELKPLTITVRASLAISGLGNTKTWQLIKEKKIATIRIGRRVLIVYRSLEELLTTGRMRTPATSPGAATQTNRNGRVMSVAAELAYALGDARREGQNWRCRCPLHGGQSLVLRDGDTGGYSLNVGRAAIVLMCSLNFAAPDCSTNALPMTN